MTDEAQRSPPGRNSAKLDRLTDKEKECLRLWLGHRTAKEIALELGVSHHAIEKRLKTARIKLDVGTSLEAARLLAEQEGYEQTAYQSSDLPLAERVSPTLQAQSKPLKGITMSFTVLATAALALLAFTAEDQSIPSATARASATFDTSTLPFEPATESEIRTWLQSIFTSLDKDSSGFIELREAPASYPLQQGSARIMLTGSEAQKAFTEAYDNDDDRKVSLSEYTEHSLPTFLGRGIPVLPAGFRRAE